MTKRALTLTEISLIGGIIIEQLIGNTEFILWPALAILLATGSYRLSRFSQHPESKPDEIVDTPPEHQQPATEISKDALSEDELSEDDKQAALNSTLALIAETLIMESSIVQQESDRIRSLLEDAVATMDKSFRTMYSLSEIQNHRSNEMIQKIVNTEDEQQDSDTMQSFIDQGQSAANSFSDLIEQTMLRSTVTKESIEQISQQILEVFDLLKEIDNLSESMQQISDNAALQAAYADEMGGEMALFTRDVQTHFDATGKLNERISEQVTLAHSQIGKLSERIEETAESGITEAVSKRKDVERLFSEMDKLNDIVSKQIEEVSDTNKELTESISNVIRSLQFEDLATQSLAYLKNNTDSLKELATTLKQTVSSDAELNADRISKLQASCETLMTSLKDKRERRAVSQTSMDEGDINLF